MNMEPIKKYIEQFANRLQELIKEIKELLLHNNTGMVWATKKALMERVADVPENWLRAFVVRHPEHFRKFDLAKGGSAMYRVSAVLEAIETGEGMPNGGIKENAYKINQKEVA